MTKKRVRSVSDIRAKKAHTRSHTAGGVSRTQYHRNLLWSSVSYPVSYVYNFITSSLVGKQVEVGVSEEVTQITTSTSTSLTHRERATRNAAARGIRRRYILSYTKNTARAVFSKRWMRQAVRWDLVGVSLSKCWGTINSRPLPVWARRPIYQMWGKLFKCNMEEVREPLHSYPTLAAFFARQLKDGARPIAPVGMASPVDGRVISCGPVDGDLLEQIKGKTYSLSSFLGCKYDELCVNNTPERPTKLFQCIVSSKLHPFFLTKLVVVHFLLLLIELFHDPFKIYLSPGDYHRIHFPVSCSVNKRRHFPGTLFPVNYPFLKMIPSLFALNERVVLMGGWSEGFFSLTAVGAYL